MSWIGLQSRIANSKSGAGGWLLEGSIHLISAICYSKSLAPQALKSSCGGMRDIQKTTRWGRYKGLLPPIAMASPRTTVWQA
jgi:hypothetical protein